MADNHNGACVHQELVTAIANRARERNLRELVGERRQHRVTGVLTEGVVEDAEPREIDSEETAWKTRPEFSPDGHRIV